MQTIIVLLVAGLPVALALSWVFDITADGIVRAQEVDSDTPALSNRQAYGLLGGMFALAAVFLFLVWPQSTPPLPEITADSDGSMA